MSLDVSALNELETSAAATSLDSAFNNERLLIDFSGVETGPPLWPKDRYLLEVIEVERKVAKSGTPYALLTLVCRAGVYKGKKITDMLMLEGKGLARTLIFLEAAGLLGAGKRFDGTLADFIGKILWANVIIEESEYQGETQKKNKISFRGYEPANKYPIPNPNDPFAAESAGPSTASATFSRSEPLVAAGASDKPAWE